MVQPNNQQRPVQQEGSGMGVIAGVLLAVIIAVGAYFFFRNENPDALMPAAGVEAPATDATTEAPATTDGTTVTPAPMTEPAPAQ